MYKLIALFVCLLLALSGCAPRQDASLALITPAPAATEAPPALGAGSATIYYPAGASEADAAYRVTYSLPSFGALGPAGEAMDAAMAAWLAELLDRVEADRLPLADRAEGEAPPATEVTYELREAQTPLGAFTNVLLYEASFFDSGAAPEQALSILVFDEDGAECSLASASGVYAPGAVAAQQVWNIISRDPAAYHGDLSLEDVAAALDLYNGFTVAEEGYTLFVQPGVLAPEGDGSRPLEFSFGRNAIYPDFVGEALTAEEYEALLPQFFALATHCGPGFKSWEAAEGLPQADAYSHGLKLEEARLDGTDLVLSGLLMKGLPGEADTVEAARAELRLSPGPQGGWAPQALTIR